MDSLLETGSLLGISDLGGSPTTGDSPDGSTETGFSVTASITISLSLRDERLSL